MKKVKVINDCENIPEGSVASVIRETKNTYRCLWASSGGSYGITLQKKNVVILKKKNDTNREKK